MARGCGCTGSSCGCSVVAGDGIEVHGNGTAVSPFIVTYTGGAFGDAFNVRDSASVDMTLLGAGTAVDPFSLSAVVKMKLSQLTNVSLSNTAAVPSNKQILRYESANQSWEYEAETPVYTTAGRPAAAGYPTGFMIFDSTLARPVFRSAAGTWIDPIGSGGGGTPTPGGGVSMAEVRDGLWSFTTA